jgi:aryl-phospho-beta-D-glucosidase BglC (GH1 family)
MGGWLSQIDAIQEKDPDKFPGIDRHMETFIGAGNFAHVKNWGFDHVRIPLIPTCFSPKKKNLSKAGWSILTAP